MLELEQAPGGALLALQPGGVQPLHSLLAALQALPKSNLCLCCTRMGLHSEGTLRTQNAVHTRHNREGQALAPDRR